MPPERSGIADYSALLLPALQARCEVAVVKRGAKKPPRGTDLCVYHVGNNPDAHGWIVEALRRTPGVVVLHDFVLHHLVAGLTIGRRDGHGYLDAMEREGGVVGRLLGHAVLDKRIPPLWENRPQDFHLAGEVLGLATGLDRPLPLRPRPGPRGRLRRAGLDRARIPPSRCRDTEPAEIAGRRRSSARSATSTRASACRSCSRRSRACGGARREPACSSSAPPRPASTSTGACSGSGSTSAGLVREGYVDEQRLWGLMKACDVHVSLRSPTMGETSGTAIRALSLGKPLVVSDVGWFSELPDDVALKVPVDDDEVDDARRRARAPRLAPGRARCDGCGRARARATRARPRPRRRPLRLGVRAGGRRQRRLRRRACAT